MMEIENPSILCEVSVDSCGSFAKFVFIIYFAAKFGQKECS